MKTNAFIQNGLAVAQLKMTTTANRFIYYFKKIWLIGKIIPDNIYADSSLKLILSWFIAVIVQSYKFTTKAIYIGLLMIFPLFLQYETEIFKVGFSGFVHLFFVMTVVFGGIQESETFKITSEKFACLKYMKMNAKSYEQVTVGFKYLLNFIYFFPSVLICTLLFGKGFFAALALCLMMTVFRFVGELLHIIMYDKLHIILNRKIAIQVIVILLTAVWAYAPILSGKFMVEADIVLSIPFVLAFLAIGAVIFYYVMFGYKNYHKTLTRTLDMEFTFKNQQKNAQASSFKDVKMKAEDLKQVFKEDKFSSKVGYDYMNAIFFSRHRRQLSRPIIIRLIIVFSCFAAFVILHIIDANIAAKGMTAMTKALPLFVFGMYIISTANKACRAMFYNCDIALLRYSFYRKPDVILKNFKTRLFKVASGDLIVSSAIAVVIILLTLITGISWVVSDMLMFIVTILLLSVFFSVHHLCMYYVFQPYTSELNLKNPFFSLINGVIYGLCFICLQIQTAGGIFPLIVLCSTVVYIVIALLLVYKFSPKTFRVK